MQNGRDYSINVTRRTEVLIRSVLKRADATVANAVANSMTNSIANNNEQVHIIVHIHLLWGCEDILMSEQVLVRRDLDHYEMVEHVHRLQEKLKQYLA